MQNLHNLIINIPVTETDFGDDLRRMSYLYGHRDARHAAAELALKADNTIVQLFLSLKDTAVCIEQWMEHSNPNIHNMRNKVNEINAFGIGRQIQIILIDAVRDGYGFVLNHSACHIKNLNSPLVFR